MENSIFEDGNRLGAQLQGKKHLVNPLKYLGQQGLGYKPTAEELVLEQKKLNKGKGKRR